MTLVSDVMTANPDTLSPQDPLRVAKEKMQAGNFRRLPVVQAGELVGILSDRDLRRATNSPLVLRERWYDNMLLENIRVLGVMTPDPLTIDASVPLVEAAKLMRDKKIGGLPVLSDEKLVGIITETDLLDYLIRQMEPA